MIPIKDTIPSRSYPIVNVLIIITNCLVFFLELSLGSKLNKLFLIFGMVPVKFYYLISTAPFNIFGIFLPFLTSLFLHAGWIHIIGNMLYLWIFGDNVEDRMGHFRYLVFYLICGVVANITHLYTEPVSGIPTIGASGAIAGVMGAYFVLYPRAKVVTLVPIFFFFYLIEIPAFFFLGFWFLLQFLSGSISLAASGHDIGGIAWWAHIGGFLSGIVLVFIFRKKKRHHRIYRDQYT